MLMFPYDATLIDAVQTVPTSVADVLRILGAIDRTCVDGDGLKWFNWLYLQVTQAVASRLGSGAFSDPNWLAALDVEFAKLYFGALGASLTGATCPGCWRVVFESRNIPKISRIQFAFSGVNAHINHDLPQAIVTTCRNTSRPPQHGSQRYNDYTALNPTLDTIIDVAKQTLHVRLLGDPLPAVSHLEDTIAAWSVSAAREKAWRNAEILWHLQPLPELVDGFEDSLDGLTTVVGKTLLVPIP